MRPLLLDLFCGAGGAAMGYHRAGFDVVGVDLKGHHDYPFPQLIADATDPPVRWGAFAAVHASPPCQAYSTQGRSSRWGTEPSSPPLIAEVQAMLDATGLPFVIENVPGARSELREPLVVLRGPDVGLHRIDRLRYFELGRWFMLQHPHERRQADGPLLGVYGRNHDGRRLSLSRTKDQLRAPKTLDEAKAAMGMEWCTEWRGVAEAIPPAYTEHIGRQLLAQLEVAA